MPPEENNLTPPPLHPSATQPTTPDPNTPDPNAAPSVWAEYVPDTTKSEEENTAAKAEHDKTKPAAPEPKKEEPPAPLKLEDIKIPEGMEVSPDQFTELSGVLAQEDPKARAQGLLDLYAKVAKEASEKGSQAWADTQKQWADETRSDPDFGGPKLDASLGSISKLIDEYSDTPVEVRQILDLTGAGNSKPVFRLLAKIAATLAEGKPTPGGMPTSTDDAASKMYPTMRK